MWITGRQLLKLYREKTGFSHVFNSGVENFMKGALDG